MDRSIPRGLDSKIIQIDSAFRRQSEPVSDYTVFFDSLNKSRSKIIKDVVALRINNASLPKVPDNIIAGLNVINLHVTTNNPIAKNVSSESELLDYLNNLNPNLLFTSEEKETKKTKIYKIRSRNANQLLTSTSNFPGATLFETEYSMLITSSPKIWNITFPINLNLSSSESHRILLKPGYYPTSSMMIAELFEAFQGITSSINENLQYTNEWDDTSDGWSVYKKATGGWNLEFKSLDASNHMNIYFSREPGPNDVLQQLGLRNTEYNNWTEPKHARKQNELFKMHNRTHHPQQETSDDNTIIGSSLLNVSNTFVLEFEQINLSPRRYVDILIQNIPYSLVTNSTSHNNVFARVDLTKKISTTTTQSNIQDNFDEASSSDTYVMFENMSSRSAPLFDPISLDHLEVKLIDNLGYPYVTEKDHTIQIEIMIIGDATVPFDFPVSYTGSVSPPRRSLADIENTQKKRKKANKQHHAQTPILEPPSPMSDWIRDNKMEIAASTLSFFSVLYIAHKLGAFWTPSIKHSADTAN